MVDPAKGRRNHSGSKAIPQHEVDARLLREKTARLRELRLAQEAARGAPDEAAAGKKKAGKPRGETRSLSDWLATQQNEGRRG
jgi:hypothetical protein